MKYNDPKLHLKKSRCCKVRVEISTENKPTEKPGDWHYKCPSCNADPCLIILEV